MSEPTTIESPSLSPEESVEMTSYLSSIDESRQQSDPLEAIPFRLRNGPGAATSLLQFFAS